MFGGDKAERWDLIVIGTIHSYNCTLLGGANLAKSFAESGLIDEIILTIVPQILGGGIPLGLSFNTFYLTSKKPLLDGMIQQIYLRNQL